MPAPPAGKASNATRAAVGTSALYLDLGQHQARGLLLFLEDAQSAIGVDHDFTPIFPFDGWPDARHPAPAG